jgi:hypothetical protein
VAILGAFFAGRLAAYAGQPVTLESAQPAWIGRALHDQFLLVAGLIAVAVLFSLWAGRTPRKDPAA